VISFLLAPLEVVVAEHVVVAVSAEGAGVAAGQLGHDGLALRNALHAEDGAGECGREWPVYRHRLQHLIMAGWKPGQPLLRVGWCGHSQQFTPWPDTDGYWRLVPVLGEAV